MGVPGEAQQALNCEARMYLHLGARKDRLGGGLPAAIVRQECVSQHHPRAMFLSNMIVMQGSEAEPKERPAGRGCPLGMPLMALCHPRVHGRSPPQLVVFIVKRQAVKPIYFFLLFLDHRCVSKDSNYCGLFISLCR